MENKDISKLNYFGTLELLTYNDLEQCFTNKKVKNAIDNAYSSLFKKIFSENEDVYSMMQFLVGTFSKDKRICFEGGLSNQLKFCSESLMLEIALFLGDSVALKNELDEFKSSKLSSKEDVYDIFRIFLKKLRIKIDEYDDFKKLQSDYLPLNSLYETMKIVKENLSPDDKIIIPSLDTYKKELKQCLTSLIVYSKYMIENAENYVINLPDEGFDYDKFVFIVLSKKIQYLSKMEDCKNEIYPILTYINENRDKDNSRKYFHQGNNKYTYDDFLKDVYEYIKNHPNINFDIIPSGFFDGWDYDDIDEFLDMYTDDSKKNFEVVDPEYIFLPNGSIKKDDKKVIIDSAKKKSNSLRLAVEKREFYDKNRDKIHKVLLGKNKFKGYAANVLDNGYVIFEKYDIVNGCLSNKLGAAYIMNIDNFNRLSSKNIQEIRRIVREQSSDLPVYQKINYVCHSGNWQEKLQAYFDQYTGIKKEDIDKVVVNSSDRNLQDNKKVIYTKQG